MQRGLSKRLNCVKGFGSGRAVVILSAAVAGAIGAPRSGWAVAPAGIEWLGTGSNDNWSTTANWSGTSQSPATNRSLIFGGSWSGTSPLGFTTANDSADGNITLNQLLFEPSTTMGVPDQTFTLTASGTGSTGRMLDNSGSSPSITVTSTAGQRINMPLTFKNSSAAIGPDTINATNGGINFNSTFLVEAANSIQVNLTGNSGNVIAFNGLVTDGTTVTTNNASRLAITGNEDVVFSGGLTSASGLAMDMLKQGTGQVAYQGSPITYTGLPNAVTSGTNALFIDLGNVSIGTGAGSIGATNGSTTGMVALGPSGAITGTAPFSAQISIANSGVNVGNPIDVRFFTGASPETKTIGGTNPAGTVTFSGNVTLHDSVTLTSGNGTTEFTQPIAAGVTALFSGETSNTTAPGVTVTGTGIVKLDGANSYTGATNINSGNLRIDGSTVAASAFSVGNATVSTASPTLSGVGTINGSVIVSGSGTIGQINAGDDGVGTLTTGPLTLNAASGLDLTLGVAGSSQGSPGVSNMVAVNGALSLPTSGPVNVDIFGTPANGWYKIATQTSITGGNATFTNTFSVVSSPLSNKNYNFVNNGGSEIDLDITSLHTATAMFGSSLPASAHFNGVSHPAGADDVNVVGSNGNYVAGYLNNITNGDNGGATGYATIGSLTPGDAELVAVALTVSDTAGGAHSLSSDSDSALADIVNDLRASVAAGISVYEFSSSDAGLALPSQYASAASTLTAGEAANGGQPFDIMFVTTDPQYLSLDFSPELNNLDGLTSIQVTDIAAIPEPASISLGLVGGAGLLLRRRRPRNK